MPLMPLLLCLLPIILFSIPSINAADNNFNCPTSNRLWTSAHLQPNFCATVIAGGGDNDDDDSSRLYKPRGLHIDKYTDEILLVDRGHPDGSRVVRIDTTTNNDSDDDTTIVPVAILPGLNHGLEANDGYLYASTPGKVYRWPYIPSQMIAGDASNAELVITNIDAVANSTDLGARGGHTTRTLAFDTDGRYLYVSTGSVGNVDSDSFRSRIRRFDMSTFDGTPFDFVNGQVFADGLRNEVGLAFDSHGDLWGVENGADNLYRDDLGGDVHNENPGEELNRFTMDQIGQHWGYPYCFTEYCLSPTVGGSGIKGGNNTVWAWPSFINDGYTDEWCRENTNPSVISMPSHSAPLGITFYDWNSSIFNVTTNEDESQECSGGFPKAMDKFAFIAYHGSWNRQPPAGYKVVFVPFDRDGNALYQPIDLFRHGKSSAKWSGAAIRPVDVQFDKCGRLYVTEDGTGSVILITYHGDYFDEIIDVIGTDVADGVGCQALPFPVNATVQSASTVSVNEVQMATAAISLFLVLLFLV